ncbi:hypothetical protein ACFL4W_01880 [Planctomycetota bacterium]
MRRMWAVLVLVVVLGCAAESHYHELALMYQPRLQNGVIVGIEKYPWDKVDQKKGIDLLRYRQNVEKPELSRELQKYVAQSKAMIASHIIEYDNGIRREFYNNYIYSKRNIPGYGEGYKQLDRFREYLTLKLGQGKFTHLILISMGWHNDQYESLARYERMVAQIKIQADAIGVNFKPYIVGITWPSSWLHTSGYPDLERAGHALSYFNKAGDADEIGYTIGNYLVHNVILAAVKDCGKRMRTIAIGHSLGARLVSRALFSRGFLRTDLSLGRTFDLYIGLQPAFSANRFIEDGGIEGSPYSDFKNMQTNFLVTSSEFDKANPIAFWSEHLGGKDAWDTVIENEKDYHFLRAGASAGTIENLAFEKLWTAEPGTVKFVECGFIEHHNDILDDEMGLFLLEVIRTLGIPKEEG